MKQKGVTLLELIVVVTSIMLLLIIGMIEFFNMREMAIRQNALNVIQEMANSLTMYKADYADYAPAGEININHTLRVYINLTTLLGIGKKVNSVSVATPYIYGCITATVRNLTPIYYINRCVEHANTNRLSAPLQPTCCWTKGGVDCTNDANWYACRSKL